jgi:phospholipid/cholesterol/gamma-HCH transport system substrate-binding protein
VSSETLNKNQLKVGAFLVAGLFAILLTILLLGGEKAFFKKHVFLYVDLLQTQGLDRGSIVSLSGMVIGNIAEIKFSQERKGLIVKMKIQEDFLPRLTKSSLADIRTQGALGDKYIFITPGEPNDPSLQNGDFITASKTTDLMGLISEKGGEATKVFDIINEVYKLTKIINADGRSEKIVLNFVEASRNFKATSEETQKLISDLRGQNPAKLKDSI